MSISEKQMDLIKKLAYQAQDFQLVEIEVYCKELIAFRNKLTRGEVELNLK